MFKIESVQRQEIFAVIPALSLTCMSLMSVGTTGGSRARMEEQEPTEEHRFTRIRQASEETEGVYRNTDEGVRQGESERMDT